MNTLPKFVCLADWWSDTKGPLGQAAIHSVIGIVIVFLALLFISFIISLFKYIAKIEQRSAEKKAEKNLASNATKNAVSQIAAGETDYVNNFELVAVITAAINEFEEARGNSFKNGMVVRSIRKIG